MTTNRSTGAGVAAGIAAYALWGFLPFYWKAVEQVPPLEILCHRIIWSVIFLLPFAGGFAGLLRLRALLDTRTLRVFIPSALLLGANWLTYIYAVNTGRIIESSLGYFLTPFVSMFLGRLLLGETLRPVQKGAVGIAAAGVGWMVVRAGGFPGIALFLAVTFGIYGLLRKIAPLGSIDGLMLETLLLAPAALGWVLVIAAKGTGAFGGPSLSVTLLLVGAGAVTSLPLLLFGASARRVSLTAQGFMQYISPTIQFFLGWLRFGEPLSPDKFAGFLLIWAALALFTVDSLRAAHHR
ncbi:MAG TPA: EamA family transporter RarD [Candidatus Ozemobacteraceae bacterium]|nr:EamA family transporter RarD [Candidatus Ozemobacteraceae bacterium]